MLLIATLIGTYLYGGQNGMPHDSLRCESDSAKYPLTYRIMKSQPDIPLAELIEQLAANMLADSTPKRTAKMLENYKFTAMDSLIYYANPFFTHLVFPQKNISIHCEKNLTSFSKNYFGTAAQKLNPYLPDYRKPAIFSDTTGAAHLSKIRRDAYIYLANNAATLFSFNAWELPDVEQFRYRIMMPSGEHRVNVSNASLRDLLALRIAKAPVKLMYWQPALNALVQFSQNYVSPDWYTGGTGSLAMNSVVNAGLIYTNFRNIKWETTAEWRTGFINIADSSAVRQVNTSEDILKIDSKFNITAKGNWAYSASMGFATQFFYSFKSYNSFELKAKFLTPVRLNVSLGMDYSCNKIFSLMIAPVACKMIYLTDTAAVFIGSQKVQIDPNAFGIQKGQNKLTEIGSALTAQLKWNPFDGLQINSVLKFYTNYKRMEIDWETIADFAINRFLSTRILLNPRYDNTIILPRNERAKIQFKELLSFGFSYKFR
jgi:hypothetical protein